MINVVTFYRVGRWLYLHHIPLFPRIIQLLVFLLYNSKIQHQSVIGKETYFVCKGIGTVLIPGTIIGNNCTIGLRFSTVRKFPYKNVPIIKDNVWVGPNVVIAGPVIIESNVIIGANSFVNKSVPAGSIVAGNPAKIIGKVQDLDYSIADNPKYKDGIAPYLKIKE